MSHYIVNYAKSATTVCGHVFFANIFTKTKNFAKPFYPVYMGTKKRGETRDTVPLKTNNTSYQRRHRQRKICVHCTVYSLLAPYWSDFQQVHWVLPPDFPPGGQHAHMINFKTHLGWQIIIVLRANLFSGSNGSTVFHIVVGLLYTVTDSTKFTGIQIQKEHFANSGSGSCLN